MREQAIYIPSVGKPIPRLCRATGYIDKEKEISERSQRALADVESEHMMLSVGMPLSSAWRFVATEKILNRWFHHYAQNEKDVDTEHLWIETGHVQAGSKKSPE